MRALSGLVIVASLVVAALTVPTAEATPVTVEGCSNCYGSAYSLDVSGQGTQRVVTLTIDPSLFAGPASYEYISAVNFKITPGVDGIVGAVLTEAPGGLDAWLQATNSSLSTKNLCGGNGSAGFVCSQVDATPIDFSNLVDGVPNNGGGVLTWKWNVTLAEGVTPFDGLLGAHIGAKYDDKDGGLKGWITSTEVAAPVPEPSTLLLLGSGLLGLGGFAWRRNRKG